MSKQDSTDRNVLRHTGVGTIACRQPLACAMVGGTLCGNKPNQKGGFAEQLHDQELD